MGPIGSATGVCRYEERRGEEGRGEERRGEEGRGEERGGERRQEIGERSTIESCYVDSMACGLP